MAASLPRGYFKYLMFFKKKKTHINAQKTLAELGTQNEAVLARVQSPAARKRLKYYAVVNSAVFSVKIMAFRDANVYSPANSTLHTSKSQVCCIKKERKVSFCCKVFVVL